MPPTPREDAAALHECLAEPLEPADVALGLGLLAVGLASYWALTPDGLASADAAVYLQQVRAADFSSRPTHTGYYLLAWCWAQLFGEGNRAINQLSTVFAACSLFTVWLLSLRLVRNRWCAFAAVCALAFNALFVFNAVHAEVYMAESALLLISLYQWLRGRSAIAGILLAAATLVTPSALFMAPAFVVLRPRWKPLLTIGLASLLGLVLAIGPMASHYLFGNRGLLSGASSGVDVIAAVRKEGLEVVLGFFCTWIFVAAGALAALMRARWRSLVWALGLGWLANFVLGERFGDVPVQLPLYLVSAPLVALALAELPGWLGRRRLAAFAVLVAGGLAAPAAVLWALPLLQAVRDVEPSYLLIVGMALLASGAGFLAARLPDRGFGLFFLVALTATAGLTATQMRTEQRAVADFRQAVSRKTDLEPLAVGGWSQGILFEHYRYGRAYTSHWVDERLLQLPESDPERRTALEQVTAALGAGQELWLLSSETPAAIEELPLAFEARGPVRVARRKPSVEAGTAVP